MKVLTMGTFDMLHAGHMKLFKRCREMSDYVIVGLNTDEFIEAFKGRKPVMSWDERKEMIMETGLVDAVIPNAQMERGSSSLKTILRSGANLLVVGSDWLRKDYLEQIGVTVYELEDNLISLCYVPYTRGISTTELKRRLNDKPDNPVSGK